MRRTIILRTIPPIAAIARTIGPYDRSRAIPDAWRPIRITPTTPYDVVVVHATRSPVPSPTSPSPGAIVNQQRSNAYSHAETDQRSHDHRIRTGRDVDHRRIVLRHINHLRIGRLNYIDCLACGLLHQHLLLCRASQRSRRICLVPEPLNRGGDRSLVSRKRLADGGIVINVLRHHLQHLRKIHQRDKCRIESLLLCRVGQCSARKPQVVLKPILDIQNFLRIRRGGGDLGKQGVRVKCDWASNWSSSCGVGNAVCAEREGPKSGVTTREINSRIAVKPGFSRIESPKPDVRTLNCRRL
jgi:hypothetical protein